MSLVGALGQRLRGHVVVVGVGNPSRGDDGAGCRVAARLREHGRVSTIDAEEIPESFLGDIVGSRPDTALFVDAVELGARPGSVALLDRDQLEGYSPTSHRFSLGMLMELVQVATGADVLLVAIQPRHLDLCHEMSTEVAASADQVAELVEELVAMGSGVEGRA